MSVKNQKGFSLPEIMVAMGLMGGISIVTMKLVQDQQGNQAYIQANAEISKTIGIIQNAINKPENCAAMLRGVAKDTRTDAGTVIPQLTFTTLNQITKTNETVILLKQDKNYGSFYLQPNAIQLASNPTFTTGSVADLIIKFKIKKLSMNLWGSSATEQDKDLEVIKRIPVVVTVDGSNIVTSCGPVVSETNTDAKRKFCESLTAGGVTQFTTDGRCVLKSMDCDWGKIPKDMGQMGVINCQPVEQVVPANQLFNTDLPSCPVGAGGVRLESDGNGRIKLKCL